jgi:hypothetical protein
MQRGAPRRRGNEFEENAKKLRGTISVVYCAFDVVLCNHFGLALRHANVIAHVRLTPDILSQGTLLLVLVSLSE